MKINMKKLCILFFAVTFLFTSCKTTIETVNNNSSFTLNEDEGFAFFKIINESAGKTIDEFYYSNGTKTNRKPFI